MGTGVEPRNQDLTGSLEEAGVLREQAQRRGVWKSKVDSGHWPTAMEILMFSG